MLKRMLGALARAILMAILIALPALLLQDISADSTPLIVLLALLAACLTYAEYAGAYPSIIEFRDAPPFNRLRYLTLFVTVLALTLINAGAIHPTETTEALRAIGTILGRAIDFPFSPVRLIVLMLPEQTPAAVIESVRMSAALAYLTSLMAMAAFVIIVRIFNWPMRSGAFNVWINLPLFDPTAGGDVVPRLKRDALFNMSLGFLLPFLIPGVVKATSDLIDPVNMADPQTMIWTISAWAFLPASMIMRGIAMIRIAEMIDEKRRRAYARDARLQNI